MRWENVSFFEYTYACDPSSRLSWKIKPCSEGFSTHLWGFQEDRWENMLFIVNLGMWPLKWNILENEPCSEGFQCTFMGKLFFFRVRPWHGTPQINHLRKTSPVLWVSTHIYWVSKKIDQTTCIFRVNLGMWPLKSLISEKQALFWWFQHTFMGFPRRWDQETCLFSE